MVVRLHVKGKNKNGSAGHFTQQVKKEQRATWLAKKKALWKCSDALIKKGKKVKGFGERFCAQSGKLHQSSCKLRVGHSKQALYS